MVFVHLKIISISYQLSPFLSGGWGKKSSKCVALFARLGRIGRLGQVQNKTTLRPPEIKSSRGHWPPKNDDWKLDDYFPFSDGNFFRVELLNFGGYYKGNGFNFTSNICCLIPLNVRKVPSNHPCKFETKRTSFIHPVSCLASKTHH